MQQTQPPAPPPAPAAPAPAPTDTTVQPPGPPPPIETQSTEQSGNSSPPPLHHLSTRSETPPPEFNINIPTPQGWGNSPSDQLLNQLIDTPYTGSNLQRYLHPPPPLPPHTVSGANNQRTTEDGYIITGNDQHSVIHMKDVPPKDDPVILGANNSPARPVRRVAPSTNQGTNADLNTDSNLALLVEQDTEKTDVEVEDISDT